MCRRELAIECSAYFRNEPPHFIEAPLTLVSGRQCGRCATEVRHEIGVGDHHAFDGRVGVVAEGAERAGECNDLVIAVEIDLDGDPRWVVKTLRDLGSNLVEDGPHARPHVLKTVVVMERTDRSELPFSVSIQHSRRASRRKKSGPKRGGKVIRDRRWFTAGSDWRGPPAGRRC